MPLWKRAVLGTVILLACAGVYTALVNLPVSSGCTFYGECPDDAKKAEVPAVASNGGAPDAVNP